MRFPFLPVRALIHAPACTSQPLWVLYFTLEWIIHIGMVLKARLCARLKTGIPAPSHDRLWPASRRGGGGSNECVKVGTVGRDSTGVRVSVSVSTATYRCGSECVCVSVYACVQNHPVRLTHWTCELPWLRPAGARLRCHGKSSFLVRSPSQPANADV